jgi:hypothetical protein
MTAKLPPFVPDVPPRVMRLILGAYSVALTALGIAAACWAH